MTDGFKPETEKKSPFIFNQVFGEEIIYHIYYGANDLPIHGILHNYESGSSCYTDGNALIRMTEKL